MNRPAPNGGLIAQSIPYLLKSLELSRKGLDDLKKDRQWRIRRKKKKLGFTGDVNVGV